MQLIPGIHAINLLLRYQPERIIEIFIAQNTKNPKIELISAEAQAQGISIQILNPGKMDHLLNNINHQGIAARCRPLKTFTEHDLTQLIKKSISTPLFLILDNIQDPHNLGACLRSANASGVTAVIIPKDRSAQLTPLVHKIASGAADFTPVVVVTNLARALKKLQEEGIFIIGLAGEASSSLFSLDLSMPLGLVLGSEENGLRRLTREYCDELAYLPMQGVVSSLNVSVAAGISLFEALRQRTR